MNHRDVQAAQYTENRRKSETENARTIAARNQWRFDDDDRLTDTIGEVIAYTIEDAAAAMVQLGWITPDNWRTNWLAMPSTPEQAALDLRAELDDEGRFPARWTQG